MIHGCPRDPRIFALLRSQSGSRQSETGCGIAEYGAMVDAECFDPALLAESEADEKTELDQLRSRKMSMQFCPERVVGDV